MTLLMLDTDVSSYIIKGRPDSLISRFERHAEEVCVSVITAAELRFGAERVQRPKLTELVEGFLERLSILDWTNAVTHLCSTPFCSRKSRDAHRRHGLADCCARDVRGINTRNKPYKALKFQGSDWKSGSEG
jgi:PIN domain